MDAESLRTLQASVKTQYREDPESATQTLSARGTLGPGDLTCRVETFLGDADAGLHPAAGGGGESACSGDMLLQSLVACAGVTLSAVATALGITLRAGTVVAEGDLDFRGTLGVSKEVPVGFKAIRLLFEVDTDASEEQLTTLLKLTERYCVIYQTLQKPPPVTAAYLYSGSTDEFETTP
jgi:uncharacterized OsmC-like protein